VGVDLAARAAEQHPAATPSPSSLRPSPRVAPPPRRPRRRRTSRAPRATTATPGATPPPPSSRG
jgi:hypothetical protein